MPIKKRETFNRHKIVAQLVNDQTKPPTVLAICTGVVPCKLSAEGAFALLNGDWKRVTIIDPDKRGGCAYEYTQTGTKATPVSVFKSAVFGNLTDLKTLH